MSRIEICLHDQALLADDFVIQTQLSQNSSCPRRKSSRTLIRSRRPSASPPWRSTTLASVRSRRRGLCSKASGGNVMLLESNSFFPPPFFFFS